MRGRRAELRSDAVSPVWGAEAKRPDGRTCVFGGREVDLDVILRTLKRRERNSRRKRDVKQRNQARRPPAVSADPPAGRPRKGVLLLSLNYNARQQLMDKEFSKGSRHVTVECTGLLFLSRCEASAFQ